MKTNKISCLSQNKIWTSSGNTVGKEMDNILKFTEMMYCHIGTVAQDERWKSPDQIPPELVVDLLKAVRVRCARRGPSSTDPLSGRP